jgi:hypothetical protein
MVKKTEKKDVRIVVLHRGWVLVGLYSRNGDYSILEKSHVIRRWGTSQGLGQLATEGPLSSTILDKEPNNEFHFSQIIRTIGCDYDKWQKYCS